MFFLDDGASRIQVAIRRLPTGVLAVAAALISACATMESEQVTDMERLLAAAGFEQKLADTPERKDHLKTLPQLELTAHKVDGQRRFVYADATYCQCLYMGDQGAYERYKALARQASLIDRQRQATMWRSAKPVNFGTWGEFGGGGL